jgi:hypothetical protein
VYCLSNITGIKSRRARLAGHRACMEENRNANRVLVGTPEDKRPSERPRHIWEHNIKMDLKETGEEGVEWVHLA